jgi:exopolysaccharide biosynthesis polyprenyl glycosylphosphotransferase
VRRQPHLLSPREIARIVSEHLLGIALLLAGLVLGAFLKDPHLPGLLEWRDWLDPQAVADNLGGFARRLGRYRPSLAAYVAWSSFATACLQYAMALHGLYDRQPVRRARLLLLRLTSSALVAGVAVAVVFFVVRPPELGRTALGLGFALIVLALWALRLAGRRVARPRPEAVLLLGGGPHVEAALRAAREGGPEHWRVLGQVGDARDAVAGLRRLGGWTDLARLLEDHQVDRLIVAAGLPPALELDALVAARLEGCAVASARDVVESLTGRVLEEDLGVEFLTDATSRPYGRISRLADVVLSAALLVTLSPLIVLVAVAIRLVDGAPVLFRQARIGRGGRPFVQLKFRTMRPDAEADGPSWSPRDDPRITRLGRFLRRWRVDELPNLWNVLRGDMAFVGPRPEQPYFAERLGRALPAFSLRHVVRPGVTGWAQVRHPYGSSENDARGKLRYDLFYIKHRSAALDLAILFDTVRVVLRGGGR